MSSDEVISDKKKALLAYKERLLKEIRDCEQRIDTVRLNHTQAYYDDDASSDSDSGFPVPVDLGPSTKQLKIQSSELSVRLQATQELTSLNVLESEVSVLVTPPILENGPAPTAEGLWREVTAECRVDLVPFSIRFYVHQPDAQFSPATYHDLKVQAVKNAHDQELSKSVLAGVTKPSDAVQILRSYSSAVRARRSSLARLADRYAAALFMEPLPEGGYTIKCGDLLDISWTLQNKWSPIAPFHHRLRVEVDFLDEDYIKTIKQSHKLLMDPSLETDERTEILSKMIDTCLQVTGGISSAQESDFEQISPIKDIDRKRRTNLDEFTEPAAKKIKDLTNLSEGPSNTKEKNRLKDSEVMAPPKSLPKKARRASDGNVREVKNSVGAKNGDSGANNGDYVPKKAINVKSRDKKVTEKAKSNTNLIKKDQTQKGVGNKENAPRKGEKTDDIATKNNVENKKESVKNIEVTKSVPKNTVKVNSAKNAVVKDTDSAKDKKNITKDVKEPKNGDSNKNDKALPKNTVTSKTNDKEKQPNVVTKKVTQNATEKITKDGAKVTKEGVKVTNDGGKLKKDASKVIKTGEKVTKDGENVARDGEKVTRDGDKVTKDGEKVTKDGVAKNADNENNENVINHDKVKKTAHKTNAVKNSITKKVIGNQNVQIDKGNIMNKDPKMNVKNAEKVTQKAKSIDVVKKQNIEAKKAGALKKVTDPKITNTNPTKIVKNLETKSIQERPTKLLKSTDIEKPKNIQNVVQNMKTKIPLPQTMKKEDAFGNKKFVTKTKIPQKLTSITEKVKTFQNPVRMSPRTIKKPIPKTNSMFTL